MESISAIDAVRKVKKPITMGEIHKVLTSSRISDQRKAEFLKHNEAEIKQVLGQDITKAEFEEMMENRQLIKYRPFKNSFTKKGDDLLLAQALGMDKKEIREYIEGVIRSNFTIHNKQDLDRIEMLKKYVYRHGTKDQVISFLQYELSDVKNILQHLYKTLDINTGGLAGYFYRPIHRLDNKTIHKLYNVIDKSLNIAADTGYLDRAQITPTAQWALVRIYQIQNNQKIIKAFNMYKDLQL